MNDKFRAVRESGVWLTEFKIKTDATTGWMHAIWWFRVIPGKLSGSRKPLPSRKVSVIASGSYLWSFQWAWSSGKCFRRRFILTWPTRKKMVWPNREIDAQEGLHGLLTRWLDGAFAGKWRSSSVKVIGTRLRVVERRIKTPLWRTIGEG